MANFNYPRTTGFNLVETAIVLGVIGLLIGGIWVAAAAVQDNMRLTRAQTQVSAIVSNLRQIFNQNNVPYNGGNAVYNSNLHPDMNRSVLPADVLAGSALKNPWNMDYSVAVGRSGSPSGAALIFLQIFVPNPAVCARLAQGLYAMFKKENNLFIDIVSDGSFGSVSADPMEAIAYCRDAEEYSSGELIYLSISLEL